MNTSNGLGMFGMLMWFLSILLMASTVGFLGDAVQSNLGEVSLSLIRFLPPTPVCQPSEYCFQNADEEMTTKCEECKPLSACNQWQYEHARPTRTSDRLCFRASPRCPATTYYEVQPPVDHSRTCWYVTNSPSIHFGFRNSRTLMG